METHGTLWIKPGKDKKIRCNYPWVQRGEITKVEGKPEDGGLATLVSSTGEFLAVGTYNSISRFPFRVFSTAEERIDQAFFERRMRAALAQREAVVTDTDSRRVLFSEADQLPGLIVDQYGPWLAVQVRTLAMDKLRELWLPALVEVFKPEGVYERSEMEGRREEGLGPVSGLLWGKDPDVPTILESGLKFLVPIKDGLKTGFYLDQRDTRRRLAEQVKPGQRVLDCFCYSGAFALYAARAGADALGVDMNEQAIGIAQKNAEMNGLKARFALANAFDYLESIAPSQEPYDWVILDPPAIAKTSSGRDSLKWAIWKLVYNALPVLKPGGRIVVCNCSYQLTQANTVDTCRLAASDRGRRLFLDGVTFQAPDHPAPVQFPEALYLKCLWLRSE